MTTIALLLISAFAPQVNAQSRTECLSPDGYWVLVSNKNTKNVTTVQFYNAENSLIYQEEIRDQKVNINRIKTLRCLKKGLDSALLAWNLEKQAVYNKSWVAINLKGKQR